MQTSRSMQAGRQTHRHASKRMQVVRHASTAPSKPVWTGDSLPSRLANWAINTPWLFSLMKVVAKDQIKRTAEGKGVKWDAHVKALQATSELHAIKEELENKDVVYPEYYFKPFHAYDQGNLNWLAAYEVEPATYSVALRTFGKIDPTLTPEKAYARLAGGATGALTSYCQKHGLPTTARNIVDVGCSVGMSTRWLASQFPDSQIMGLDLSPYFISVAEWEERKRGFTGASRRIRYVHDRVETSKQLSPASVDWMLFQYVIHECPQHAIKDFIATSARTLKPNGVLFFVDNNPRSKTMQGLPPAIAILLKSTEPWSDEYFSFDVEAAMRQGGFKEVVTVEIDHRHRAVMGIKA